VIKRSRLGNWQNVTAVLVVVNLIIIAGSTFFLTRSIVEQMKFLTSVDSTTRLVTLAVRETLIYTLNIDRWSSGLTTRRDVQIARGLLAQRLSVIDREGSSAGERASPEYFSALNESDAILESTVSGLLPVELQKSVQVTIRPIVQQLIIESRVTADNFQQQQNSQVAAYTAWVSTLGAFTVFFLLLFFMLFTVLVIQNGRSIRSNFRRSQETIQSETAKLNLLFEKLSLSEAIVISLRELSETKSAFIENVNHELRTPLSSVIGHIDIIRNITDSKPELGISKSLEVLDRNANILLKLTDNIVSLTKLDSRLVSLSDTSVDIAQVIDDCILVFQVECETSNIAVNFSIDREVGYLVKGDVEQLSRVVINLLSNAIKFSDVNSHIDIEVEESSYGENLDTIRIFVRDYGIGIPAEDMGKLFTRFYRASNARDGQFPGSGLGLAIVTQIVHVHGGDVEIESVEGEGTTITVILPKHLSSAEELVRNRRHAVLVRTITELEESSQQDLPRLTHTLGGLIGFYTFEDESKVILGFSNWLDSGNFIDPIEIEVERNAILTLLKLRLASVPNGNGANE
jgi:signal transduction histidine kinase